MSDRVQPFIDTAAELNYGLPLGNVLEAIYAQRLHQLSQDAEKSAEAGNPVDQETYDQIAEGLKTRPVTIGQLLTAAKFVTAPTGDNEGIDPTKLELGFYSVAVANLLRNETDTEDLFELADLVLHHRRLKDALKDAAGAVQDEHDRRLQQLYDAMLAKEVKNLTRGGQTFYLTSNNFVQADKEQGGTTNPNLINWLETNGMEALAAKSVNANSLRGAANKWLDQHAVSVENEDYDLDGPLLLSIIDGTYEAPEPEEGEEPAPPLTDADIDTATANLDLLISLLEIQPDVIVVQEEVEAAAGEVEVIDVEVARTAHEVYRDRVRRRNDLLSMLIITQEPTVGIRKAAK